MNEQDTLQQSPETAMSPETAPKTVDKADGELNVDELAGVSAGIAMLLPAVQSARESARR